MFGGAVGDEFEVAGGGLGVGGVGAGEGGGGEGRRVGHQGGADRRRLVRWWRWYFGWSEKSVRQEGGG